jgi:methylated-DNA-[protein]-cysteine S-methyltransferase
MGPFLFVEKMSMHTQIIMVIPSPIGKLGICIANKQLVKIDFLSDEAELSLPKDTVGKQIVKQLDAYFADPNHRFCLEFELAGTPFQKQVWRALQAIPRGQTLTYGELAKKLKTAPRAIGQACRTNPIPVIIPCHRIVAANHLGGYSGNVKGRFRDIKTWLLQHEGVRDKVD